MTSISCIIGNLLNFLEINVPFCLSFCLSVCLSVSFFLFFFLSLSLIWNERVITKAMRVVTLLFIYSLYIYLLGMISTVWLSGRHFIVNGYVRYGKKYKKLTLSHFICSIVLPSRVFDCIYWVWSPQFFYGNILFIVMKQPWQNFNIIVPFID